MPLRSFSGGALFAETFGEGPPRVLALHGWGRRGRDFSQILDGIPSLAPDLPGFGASPPPAEVIGAEGYAEIVKPLLDVFERPPVLLGHSFGGRVATCVAATNPDHVRGLVLTGAPVLRLGTASKPSTPYRLIRSLYRAGLVSEERMEAVRQRFGSADYRHASGVMRDILVRVVNESYEDQLKLIECPVALVWGSADREVPVAVARRAFEILGGGNGSDRAKGLTVIDGVGHNVPRDQPRALREVVLDMLGGSG
ncbi:MAG: alpha/beta hydrolase [Acidimicrobiia bacterium]|nr:alpha/beta hydrolase [Acidimicrobiia bacterium]